MKLFSLSAIFLLATGVYADLACCISCVNTCEDRPGGHHECGAPGIDGVGVYCYNQCGNCDPPKL
ncbi:hypothetical protein HYFRA_00009644 [Hymenoscyphus fraxineus]|uniref:Uncharacterized protein n=1 Tax=Hymenoscyphus fraxineus TaxID=746836 RepID=A0A9N9KR16_9HELO|nr:hypothetical protein HYFRA_00009644 [Hymenoscyphus fraxineus]